jgi:hypothetical protein
MVVILEALKVEGTILKALGKTDLFVEGRLVVHQLT